jgi:hypothetical protein
MTSVSPAAATSTAVASAHSNEASLIPRLSARSMTSEEFIFRFVRTNRPVILTEALTEWKPPAAVESEWSLPLLARLLGSTLVSNVFVAAAQHRNRFKFFKGDRSKAAASTAASSAAGSGSVAASSQGSIVPSAPSASSSSSNQPESGLSRRSMHFDEFVQLTKENLSDADGSNRPAYYVHHT